MGRDDASSWSIGKAFVGETAVCSQGQRRCTEFHPASLSLTIPGCVLPRAVLFPYRHPGKIAPVKQVSNAEAEFPVDGQYILEFMMRVESQACEKAAPPCSKWKSQVDSFAS